MVTFIKASAIASAAGCIRAQWKGALTGSRMARFAPLALASSQARSTAALWPEITTCPLLLSLAAWHTSPWAASLATAATSAKSNPRMAAMAPTPTGVAACMALPRMRRSRAVSLSENVPAAASAEYSPSEWPPTNFAVLATVIPCSAFKHGKHRHAHGHQGGLGIGGERQVGFRPFPHEGGQVLGKGCIHLGKHRAGGGKRIRQRLAHANRLASLARERKCNAQSRLLKSLLAPRNMGRRRS